MKKAAKEEGGEGRRRRAERKGGKKARSSCWRSSEGRTGGGPAIAMRTWTAVAACPASRTSSKALCKPHAFGRCEHKKLALFRAGFFFGARSLGSR